MLSQKFMRKNGNKFRKCVDPECPGRNKFSSLNLYHIRSDHSQNPKYMKKYMPKTS